MTWESVMYLALGTVLWCSIGAAVTLLAFERDPDDREMVEQSIREVGGPLPPVAMKRAFYGTTTLLWPLLVVLLIRDEWRMWRDRRALARHIREEHPDETA